MNLQAEVKGEAAGVFTVVVPAKRHTTLGLEPGRGPKVDLSWFVPDPVGCLPWPKAEEMDTSADVGPIIVEVKRGAVGDFNQLNPVRTIQPFDMIVQMGDKKGTKAGCWGWAHETSLARREAESWQGDKQW